MAETAERQFNARLSAYRDGLAAKAGAPTQVRMGQTLFAFAGGSFTRQDANIDRAGELLAAYLAEANEALRSSFGAAALPETMPPSAMLGGYAERSPRTASMPKGGLEPPRACAHWLLKPARLPVPPLRQERENLVGTTGSVNVSRVAARTWRV